MILSSHRLFLLTLLLAPGLFSNYGVVNNHSTTIMLSCVMFLILYLRENKLRLRMSFLLFSFIIIIHKLTLSIVFMDLFSALTLVKDLSGVFLLFLILIISQILYNIAYNDSHLDQRITKFCLFLIIWGFLNVPSHYMDWVTRKQMIFFSEPSHLALLIIPFLHYYCLFAKKNNARVRVAMFLTFVLSVMLENLTLLCGLMLVMMSINGSRIVGVFKILILGLLSGAIITILFPEFSEYILARITFGNDTTNLSLLVILSAYERAFYSFYETFAFGSGFGAMGQLKDLGNFQQRIMEFTNSYMNLRDGGALLPKLIHEFGIFGITLSLLLLITSLRINISIKSHQNKNTVDKFLLSVLATSPILLLVRYVGYFSTSTVLLIFAMANYRKLMKNLV